MATYTGLNGKTYITEDNCINKGGEGRIYRIKSEKGLVAKVFMARKNTAARKRKLEAIIAATPKSAENQWVVWPVDILSCNGKFAGYVMPVLEGGKALNVMYSTDSGMTLKQKIQIARNLCLAVNSVHSMGQVVGDLNPNNILVNPVTLNLRLIDSDSYHFHDEKHTYRCEVGVDLLYPIELQEKFSGGLSPATADLPTFTRHTDEFALAAHIFALLMNGAHPYCCAIKGTYNMARLTQPMPSVTVPQPVDAIKEGFFPYVDTKADITTPSYAPNYSMYPAEIRDMFFSAFKKGNSDPSSRPTAIEWYNALVRLENNLVICKHDDVHMYPSGVSCCPWCELDGKRNRNQNTQTKAITTIAVQPASNSNKKNKDNSSNTQNMKQSKVVSAPPACNFPKTQGSGKSCASKSSRKKIGGPFFITSGFFLMAVNFFNVDFMLSFYPDTAININEYYNINIIITILFYIINILTLGSLSLGNIDLWLGMFVLLNTLASALISFGYKEKSFFVGAVPLFIINAFLAVVYRGLLGFTASENWSFFIASIVIFVVSAIISEILRRQLDG